MAGLAASLREAGLPSETETDIPISASLNPGERQLLAKIFKVPTD